MPQVCRSIESCAALNFPARVFPPGNIAPFQGFVPRPKKVSEDHCDSETPLVQKHSYKEET